MLKRVTADNMVPVRAPNVDSVVLLAVAFALLSIVVNHAILGNDAFTRSFELYFLRSVDDVGIFQKDLLIGALQYNPYFWLHRLIAVGRDALHISTGSMIVTTYFAVQVLLMYPGELDPLRGGQAGGR